jgi:hypothetical protein
MAINALGENSVEGTRLDRQLGNFSITDAEIARVTSSRVDELLKYFEQKTGGKRLPYRADISPRDLKKFLPELFLFQILYDPDGGVEDLMVQLMGTTVANFYGEITGQTVREGAPSPEVTERILIACRRMLASGRPVVAEASSLSEEKNHLRVQVLYVPMSEDGTLIDRICGYAHVSLRSAAE